MGSTISATFGNGIATLLLDRPPLNIINLEMIDEMLSGIDQALRRDDIKVLVLKSGLDDVFSGGADVKEHMPATAEKLIHRFEQLVSKLLAFRHPTVSVVQGRCLGGGMELALACDFVLATETATFGQPEVNVGVFPPAAAVLYPRLAGLKNSYKLILTGQTITAREARSMGLVTDVVEDGKFASSLEQLLNALTSKSSVALEFAKRATLENLSLPVEQALRNSSSLYLDELMKREDPEEGLSAFLEKREPVWRNR